MKIIVAGAGIGGLYAAGLFAKSGHEVVVYEKVKRVEDMRYDWHDDVNPSVFADLSVPVPVGSFPKKNWTFITPYEKGRMPLIQRADLIDISVQRKELNKVLVGLLESATIEWGTEATKAIVDGDRVVGIEIVKEGTRKEVFGDLIIDSCGVFSPIRKSLPEAFNVPDVDRESVFFVRRFFFKAKEGVPFPTDTNKVYMKHIGQKGISWCIACDNGTVDVLIGRVGKMTEEETELSLADLRKNNPILSDELLGGGNFCTIPVRRPLSNPVANGYVAIGDSACLTVPMIGSGIATSLQAADILVKTVNATGSSDVATLWQYRVKINKLFGAEHCAVETLKNWLLEQKDDDIHFFLTSGILRNEDLQNASVGKMIKLEFPDIFHKGLVGMKNPLLLLKTLVMLQRANKAKRISERIPKTYNKERVLRWQKKTDGCF